jgi:hypothetical protein
VRDMSEALRASFRRVLRLENRRAAIRPGRIEHIHGFESKILGNTREVTIYLPAGYDDRDDRRYPVLYMQDGQNLFDAERAYIPGQHWKLKEAADHAIGERTAAPIIIVGVDHAGTGRLDEYTPVKDEKHNGGGRADDYARMLVEELNARHPSASDSRSPHLGHGPLQLPLHVLHAEGGLRPRLRVPAERNELLTFEEIARLARHFVHLGARKVRLTGGEPLLRRDLERLVEHALCDRRTRRHRADDERLAPDARESARSKPPA